MNGARTYLDWNATAPLRPQAREAMLAALDVVGNPSSVHAEGRAARAVIEDAREAVARALRVRPAEVFFTSGATESAAWALTPHTQRRGGNGALAVLLTGATEHACVLQGHRFPAERVEKLGVDADGLIDLDALEARLGDLTARHGDASVLVAVQAANNETGVLQPTARIAEIAGAAGAIFVCDAVQLAGRAACDARTIGADVLLLSSHKLGGPKGAGAVVLAGDRVQPEPLIRGGGQERRQRSGTENVAAIAGFAAALAAAWAETGAATVHAIDLRQCLEAGLRAIRPDTFVFGEAAPRLSNTTCFAVPGMAAETALIALDLGGIAASSGSACSSGKVAMSHVLEAMGVAPALARGAVRVSTGPATTAADIDSFLAAWAHINSRHADRKVA
jgi:cysteine desulfurase